jgi:hypothetical protein
MGIIRSGPVNLQFSTRTARETGEYANIQRRKIKITEGPGKAREIGYEILETETPWYERAVAGAAILMVSGGQVYLRPSNRGEPTIRVSNPEAYKEHDGKSVYVSGALRFLQGTCSILPQTWANGEPSLKVDEVKALKPLIPLAGVPLFGFYKTA